ncbi:hypothetical protein GGU10DRAFT_374934 [Lentinula aff. detonsa]|uniref:Uncharacterized protein n=1 Tax=Lentinula aff. detonsa TaxID=2804958 RepID=A0AA38KGU6_9AGAR|nr:hypothetical protein GGU10DRAFT_374934 [Lentinula aff. detonsa]
MAPHYYSTNINYNPGNNNASFSTKYQGNFATVNPVSTNNVVGKFVKVIQSKWGIKLKLEFLQAESGVFYADNCSSTREPITIKANEVL